MKRQFLIPFASAVVILFTWGCVTAPPPDSEVKIKIPEIKTVPAKALPNDIKLSTAAVILRMRGVQPQNIPYVDFKGKTADNLFYSGFVYNYFWVRSVVYLDYGIMTGDKNLRDDWRMLRGMVSFEDLVGRCKATIFNIVYRLDSEKIVFEEAGLERAYPEAPSVVAFIMRHRDLPRKLDELTANHAKLYSYVVDNAISVSRLEELTAEPDEYVVFVFYMDQVSPSARIKVAVSRDKSGFSGYEKGTRYLNYFGWRVGIISGKFAMNSASPLYIKASYSPGNEVSSRKKGERLLGLFEVPTQP